MGKVIKVNFTDVKETSGYIIDEEKVEGIYQGDLVAHYDGKICRIGERDESGILNPIELSAKEMNEFCIMWLCIFNPEALKYDKELPIDGE